MKNKPAAPKTTHTPGPWTYRKTADTFHAGRPVFGVGPEKDGAVWFVCEQVYEDNARLIAASPDLLDAVEQAEIDLRDLVENKELRSYLTGRFGQKTMEHFENTIATLCLVRSKATGE